TTHPESFALTPKPAIYPGKPAPTFQRGNGTLQNGSGTIRAPACPFVRPRTNVLTPYPSPLEAPRFHSTTTPSWIMNRLPFRQQVLTRQHGCGNITPLPLHNLFRHIVHANPPPHRRILNRRQRR